MKYKMLALIVALTVVSWAQTGNPNCTGDAAAEYRPGREGEVCMLRQNGRRRHERYEVVLRASRHASQRWQRHQGNGVVLWRQERQGLHAEQ